MVPAKDTPTAAGDTAPPADSGLRCPTCGYNLTGLDASRCPECGREYDVELLRRILAGETRPIPIWDEDCSVTWRVIRLCRKTWLDPAGFAQRFPLNYRPDSAFGFRILILASTVLIWFVAAFCVVAVLSGGNLHGAEFVLLVPFIATPVGVCFCEWVLSLFLDRAVRRVGVPVIYHTSASSTSWRGLVGFFRSFLILDSVLIGGVWITSACYEPLAIPKLGWTAIAGCFVWWWICLGLAVWTCSESGTGRAIFILVIPLVGVLSILLAAFATTLCLFGLAR